jgi:PAS domain S-box-containing protein
MKRYTDVIDSDFFSNGPSVAFILNNNPNWSVLDVSKNIKTHFGYENTYFTNSHILFSDIIHARDITRFKDEIRSGCDSKQASFEHKPYRIKNFDNEYRWVKDRTTIVYDENSNINHFISYISDITDSHSMLLEYQQTSEYHKTMLNNFDFLVWLKDVNGVFLDCNLSFANAAGVEDVSSVINKTDIDFWPAELARAYVADDNYIISSRSTKKIIEEIIDGDTRKWIETYKAPIIDKSGNIIGTFGYAFDLTDKLQTQEELRKLNTLLVQESSKLNLLVRSIPDLVWLKDINGVFLSCNKRFSDCFSARQDEIVGKTDYDLVDKELADFFYANDKKAMDSDIPLSNFEEIVFANDGHKEYLHTTKTRVIDSDGNVIGILGIARDFTAQKKAEDELKMLNQELQQKVEIETNKRMENERQLLQQSKLVAMSELISNIGHQWRQPLNALGITMQGVPMALAYGELDNDYANSLKNESMKIIQNMSQMIDEFRSFCKPDKTKIEFDVKKAVDKAYLTVKDSLDTGHIAIELDLPKYETLMLGQPNEISKILVSILNNAIETVSEKKEEGNRRIKLSLSKDTANLIISITDNGGGIPTDIIDKVFEPYFTTKHKGQGVGLSLYMSKMAIEQTMNGKLSVSNTDDGACFKIELPL